MRSCTTGLACGLSIAAAVALIGPGAVASHRANETGKLAAGDGLNGDEFGAVSIWGSYALVGAQNDDNANGTDAGSAYVFYDDGTGWAQQAKLMANDGNADDYFGYRVSISGGYALVGAAYHDLPGANDAGAAYLFLRSGTSWGVPLKLTAVNPPAAAGDNFGEAVAMATASNYKAVMGAPDDTNANGSGAGSVYVYMYMGPTFGWQQTPVVLAGDGQANDHFGKSVAIDVNRIIVGAPYEDHGEYNSIGAAYVFERNGNGTPFPNDDFWYQTAKLTAPDGEGLDLFGWSVAVSGDTIVVGAYNDDIPGVSWAGSAYVFTYNGATWSYQAKLTASDAAEDDKFGTSVAASGEMAIVGAYGTDDRGESSGSAYLFERDGTTWSEVDRFDAADGAGGDWFGVSVAMNQEYIASGAPYCDVNPYSDTGAAYVYRVVVDGDINSDGSVDVDDLTALILGWGPCPASPALCPEDVNRDGQVNVDDLTSVILNWG